VFFFNTEHRLSDLRTFLGARVISDPRPLVEDLLAAHLRVWGRLFPPGKPESAFQLQQLLQLALVWRINEGFSGSFAYFVRVCN
jgi:hypothetical protein